MTNILGKAADALGLGADSDRKAGAEGGARPVAPEGVGGAGGLGSMGGVGGTPSDLESAAVAASASGGGQSTAGTKPIRSGGAQSGGIGGEGGAESSVDAEKEPWGGGSETRND